MTVPVWDRLTRYFAVGGGCWTWTGSTNGVGYGTLRISDGDGGWKHGYAHRLAYEFFVGPIPEGLDLDHLCRNRACVNPDHLEPVTRRENLLRGTTIPAANAAKTSCVNGHPFDVANTYEWRGSRYCRTCRAANMTRFRVAREGNG